ncbi:MAG: hypothetical protein Kow0029_06620 [Candidatus Rifleibacteriota bacterium]
MNTIDIIIAAGFVILLITVAIRIWLGRKRAAEIDTPVKIKQPHSKIPEPVDENYLNNLDNLESEVAGKIENSDNSGEIQSKNAGNVGKVVESRPVETKSLEPEPDVDPLVLIKTFSASPEKRIKAMKEAGDKKIVEAVPALIEALYEPDPSISAAASEALGKIGDVRAIEPLLEISRRNDAQLMKEINETWQKDEPEKQKAQNDLELSAEDEKPYNFKEMVVFKIDQLPKEYFQPDGSPIPRKDLVVKGLKDLNQQLRQMAAKAAIGLDSEEVVDPLIEALENPYEVESVRFMAAEALGGMDNEKSVTSLLKALKDENVAVRYSAAAALSGKNEDRVVMALIGAASDPDKYVRSSVAYALGTTRNRKALDVLFDCMSDESEVVRFSAAKAIACFNSEEVVKEVAKRLDFANKMTKLALMEVLGHIESDESVEILRGFLKDEDSEISYKASMALIGQQKIEVLDELIEASKRLDQELFNLMKEKAVPGLENFKESGVPKDIQNQKRQNESALLSENLINLREGLLNSSPNVRGSAAVALGDTKDPKAAELLLTVINDENEFVRASAINSLGRIGDENTLKELLLKASDPSDEVRYALVKALAKFEHDSARICLKKMAKSDQSSQVRRAARSALDKK